MEKQIDTVEEPEQAGTPRPVKGTSNTMSKRFTITVLALILLQIAFFLRNPLSGLFQKAPCHSDLGNLTIEQRAHKILKENPLIGHTTPARASQCQTDFFSRWPQRLSNHPAYALQEPHLRRRLSG